MDTTLLKVALYYMTTMKLQNFIIQDTLQDKQRLNCDISTIQKVLKSKGIKSRGLSHIVDQFDLAGNYIQTFDSAIEAGQWVVERGLSKSKHHDITKCCKGVRNKKKSIRIYLEVQDYSKIKSYSVCKVRL